MKKMLKLNCMDNYYYTHPDPKTGELGGPLFRSYTAIIDTTDIVGVAEYTDNHTEYLKDKYMVLLRNSNNLLLRDKESYDKVMSALEKLAEIN